MERRELKKKSDTKKRLRKINLNRINKKMVWNIFRKECDKKIDIAKTIFIFSVSNVIMKI